jgi:pilus assembly protein CpaC
MVAPSAPAVAPVAHWQPVVVAAESGGSSIAGLRTRLPTVPDKEPRPVEGDAAGQQWQTERTPEGADPVASFLEPLQGNDVAIDVIVGQGRLLTLKSDIATREGSAVIAAGDPTVIEFNVLPNARMIRLTGKRVGVTDLSITTADDQTYSFEVHVVYDIPLLSAQLKQIFPDAYLRLSQLREHLVVEGQARSNAQVAQIIRTIEAFLESVQTMRRVKGREQAPADEGDSGPRGPQPPYGAPGADPMAGPPAGPGQPGEPGPYDPMATPEPGQGVSTEASFARPQIINLIRVPGVHQVLLQVRIAELNRTGMREIGADILGVDPGTGNILGTQIGGAAVSALGTLGLGGLVGTATGDTTEVNTAFGIFPSGDFEILLRALRRNSLLRVLAEPNLVAMDGHQASFLAGGEFPVPVAQAGAAAGAITIEYKDFGVQLNFVPYILEDESIRIQVAPEVSSIDQALGVTLEGISTPALNTRRANTTVELREGQTLAMAGLLQVELDAHTNRIPLLGDLPYIGPMFSNTGHRKVEKELLVLVTPHLVRPMNPEQVPPLPGEDILDPSDCEFYFFNRIEGCGKCSTPSSVNWHDPTNVSRLIKMEERYIQGPVGLSE